MMESQMEEIIAQFPDDFFPGQGLVLKGRQQSFAGVGRFDLLFVDRHETNVLMELKARAAKYEDASQLAKYQEAMEQKGEKGQILMWLVAPQIPSVIRVFLDRIGIEYSEIHDVQLRRAAERHGMTIMEKSAPSRELPDPSGPDPTSVRQKHYEGYELNLNFDRERLRGLVREFEGVVRRQQDKSLAVSLRRELLGTEHPSISRKTVLQLAKWCNTNSPLYWDGMAVARKISEALFEQILDRNSLGV